MPKIILQGFIVVSDTDLPAVQAELPKHIELTRNEKGCLVFDVVQDSNNKNVFKVFEEFADCEAFEAHQARVKNSRWGAVAANVERHYRIVEDHEA